jgi:hypothetical protein
MKTLDWNPEQASLEMAELFSQANQIINQPHYQDVASADEPQIPSTGSNPTTDANQS